MIINFLNRFSYAFLFFIAAIFWLSILDLWPVGGDGNLYIDIFNGVDVGAPHGYRIFLPTLISYFTNDPIFGFNLVSVVSLFFVTLFLKKTFKYLFTTNSKIYYVALLFWLSSFPFIYYLVTQVRVDPAIFLAFSIVIYLVQVRPSFLALLIVLPISILIHEMSIIFIFYLFAEYFFNPQSKTASHLTFLKLALVLFVTSFVFLLLRFFVNVPPDPNFPFYQDKPFELFMLTLESNGGFFIHGLKFYSAFGPLLIFSFLYFFLKPNKNFLVVFLTLVFAYLLSFFAIDTIRVASLLIPLLLLYCCMFLEIVKNYSQSLFYLLSIIQILYSVVIFSNLNGIETNIQALTIGAALSFIAFILCLNFITMFLNLQSNDQ